MTSPERERVLGRLAASPCSNPEFSLEEALSAYSELGFSKFEAFTGWVRSALDIEQDPADYRERAASHGMRFTSMHLPPVGEDIEATLPVAVRGAQFASALGAEAVLFKAASREVFIESGRVFLDAIEGSGVTAVLQNHAGSPITTLADFAEVLEGIGDDRMKTVLEVGHFHTAGVSWRDGYGLLQGTIALVHIKDQIGPQPVPFGEGEIDLPALFAHMDRAGYTGDYVVEMEVRDTGNTLLYLDQAIDYLAGHCTAE